MDVVKDSPDPFRFATVVFCLLYHTDEEHLKMVGAVVSWALKCQVPQIGFW